MNDCNAFLKIKNFTQIVTHKGCFSYVQPTVALRPNASEIAFFGIEGYILTANQGIFIKE